MTNQQDLPIKAPRREFDNHQGDSNTTIGPSPLCTAVHFSAGFTNNLNVINFKLSQVKYYVLKNCQV